MTESRLKEWITVAEAAVLTGRTARAIYYWIEHNRLATRINAAGITEVLSKAVVRIEPTVRRGRPRGTPTRR